MATYVAFYIKIIVEGANGPTTIAAERLLHQKNVLVIPVSCVCCKKIICRSSVGLVL